MLKQEFRKFIIMDTKSNEFNGNWFNGMLNLWKKDVSWNSKSRKEKLYAHGLPYRSSSCCFCRIRGFSSLLLQVSYYRL